MIFAAFSESSLSLTELGKHAHNGGLQAVAPAWVQVKDDVGEVALSPISDVIDGVLESVGHRVVAIELDPLIAQTPDQSDQQADDIYMQMQMASRMGVEYVSLSGGSRDAASREAFRLGLTRLAALAERMDLCIALCNRADTLLERSEDIVEAINRFQSKAVAVDLDPFQMHRAVANPLDAVHALGSKLASVRVYEQQGDRRVCVADGGIAWTKLINTIVAAAPDVTMLFPIDGSPETIETVKSDIRWIQDAIDM